ncbi:MAG: hypothetical protein GF364_04180 [Candidatus Lokiarchaeota archaeon]|nr:hypothetical protein [Candidatus Lokiarchaeota archaeon]
MSKNYQIKDLIGKSSATNQMRNVVYHFVRYMQEKELDDNEIRIRLKRMGKNIAKTMNPLFDFRSKSPENLIKQIYRTLLHSKVSISKKGHLYEVKDEGCALCKYHRKDISVSPGTIIPPMVAAILGQHGYKVIESSVLFAKSLGDNVCTHTYEILEDD